MNDSCKVDFDALRTAILDGYAFSEEDSLVNKDSSNMGYRFTIEEKDAIARTICDDKYLSKGSMKGRPIFDKISLKEPYIEAESLKTYRLPYTDENGRYHYGGYITPTEMILHGLLHDNTPGEFTETDMFYRHIKATEIPQLGPNGGAGWDFFEDGGQITEFLLDLGDEPARTYQQSLRFGDVDNMSVKERLQISLRHIPWYEDTCDVPSASGPLEEIFPNGTDDYENILYISELEILKKGDGIGGFMQPIKLGVVPVYMKDGTRVDVELPIYKESMHENRDMVIQEKYADFVLAAAKTQFYVRRGFHSDIARAQKAVREDNNIYTLGATYGLFMIIDTMYQSWLNRGKTTSPAEAAGKSKKPMGRFRKLFRGGGLVVILATLGGLAVDASRKNPDEALIAEMKKVLDPNLSYEDYSAILDEKPYLEDIIRIISFQYGRYRDHLLEQKRAEKEAQE